MIEEKSSTAVHQDVSRAYTRAIEKAAANDSGCCGGSAPLSSSLESRRSDLPSQPANGMPL